MSPWLRLGLPGGTLARRALHVDESGALGRVLLADEFVHRYVRERHVGVEARPVGVGDLLGLDEEVPEVGIIASHGGEVVALEQIEDLERGDPLAVGGQLPQRPAAIGGRHRLDPLARVVGEIRQREEPPDLVGEGDDGRRGLTAVEGVPPAFGDPLQGVGEGRIGEKLTLRRDRAAGHEDLGEPGHLGELRGASGPGAGDDPGHRNALPCGDDGRREQPGHGQAAEPLVQLEPAVDAAGHRPGEG